MPNDPRRTRRYREAARAYTQAHLPGPAPCALCGQAIDVTLPATHPYGPTIEHLVPVRTLREHARTWVELVDLTCDTRTWALAHKRCQDQQGGRASRPAVSRW